MDRIERYRNRFTLIELLAVVALISLLMAIGVPAFSRMIRGSRVDEFARGIKLGLEQAQMRAASERRYVAVIFPNGSLGDNAQKLKPYLLGGFRTAYLKKNGSSYTFVRWVDGSDWSNAPNGAALVKVGIANFATDNGYVTGCSTSTGLLTGCQDLPLISVKDDDGTDLIIGGPRAIIFTPYGSVDIKSKLYLLVSEALIEGTAVTYPTAKGTTGDDRYTTSNYKVLKINNLTGRVEFNE